MGIQKSTIPINGQTLKVILKLREIKFSDFAKALSISRQTLNNWFYINRIPPRKLSIAVQIYHFTTMEISIITDNTIARQEEEIQDLNDKITEARYILL